MKKKKLLLIATAALAVIVIAAAVKYSAPKERSVCLDAGHGGKDVGATSADGTRYEKDDNLKLVLAVGKILKEKDVKVYYTRKDDEFLELEERTDYANKKKPACFVSLHRNSSDSPNAGGVEIWVKNTHPLMDSSLANKILDRLDSAGIKDNRGVRYGYMGNSGANYAVNSGSNMPSCLVEVGFITCQEDNELFDSNFDEYAQAIAEGIIEYLEG